MSEDRIVVGGPYFEDLSVGDVFAQAPAVTVTAGFTALHQALFGDRLRLPLDATLSAAVTERPEQLVHPMLVCNIAIGQTTEPSQWVRGNLFYRGLVLMSPVHVGDTLSTRTEVVGLKQNRRRPGKPATGLVALEIQTKNQAGETVLDFWRAPMIPLRDPDIDTGHGDAFEDIPTQIEAGRLDAAVPADWNIDVFRERVGSKLSELRPGSTFALAGRDTATSAPELARLTLNVAATHTDAQASAYNRRLVYGGHTIAIAAAAASRALPTMMTVLAWRSCDHTSAVFEEDILRTEVEIVDRRELGDNHGLVDVRALVHATRTDPSAPGYGDGELSVLDWRFVALVT